MAESESWKCTIASVQEEERLDSGQQLAVFITHWWTVVVSLPSTLCTSQSSLYQSKEDFWKDKLDHTTLLTQALQWLPLMLESSPNSCPIYQTWPLLSIRLFCILSVLVPVAFGHIGFFLFLELVKLFPISRHMSLLSHRCGMEHPDMLILRIPFLICHLCMQVFSNHFPLLPVTITKLYHCCLLQYLIFSEIIFLYAITYI